MKSHAVAAEVPRRNVSTSPAKCINAGLTPIP